MVLRCVLTSILFMTMATGAAEKNHPELGLRLIAAEKDLPALERFAEQCHRELSFYLPIQGATTVIVVCYDAPAPANAKNPVLLTSALSREEQAHFLLQGMDVIKCYEVKSSKYRVETFFDLVLSCRRERRHGPSMK